MGIKVKKSFDILPNYGMTISLILQSFMRLNRRHILLLLLGLIVLTVFLPIPVRYSFLSTAKIYPIKEWKLTRGSNEGYFSQTYNHESGSLSDCRDYRFERGDIAGLQIRQDLVFDSLISRNDTVAYMDSYFIQNEILRLANLRDVEIANLGIVSTGEKSPLVEQAERQYNYAQQQLELEKKNFARQDALFRDSVITPAEFDFYENTLKLAEINTQVAYNQLVALSTGEKNPVLEYSRELIRSYDKEIERLEAQKSQYVITTPLTGWLGLDPDTLGILRVSDLSKLVLRIPVAYEQAAYLDSLHSVTFSTPDNKYTLTATFKGFDENVKLIQSRQIVIAKATTSEFSEGIYPGMLVKCRIYCDKVTLLEFLKRNFALTF